MRHSAEPSQKRGTTLFVTMAVLAVATVFIMFTATLITSSLRSIGTARSRLLAIAVANEEIELIRNLPYNDIGTYDTEYDEDDAGGWPVGVVPEYQVISRDNIEFSVAVKPRFVDDPFDGEATDAEPDTEPSDYKRMQVTVCWSPYPCETPIVLSTNIAPPGEESAPDTGSLILHVANSSGQPVAGATVQVRNPTEYPDTSVTDETDIYGDLKLYSLPLATSSYEVIVSKEGMSVDYTTDYANALNPHLSVYDGQATQKTFTIDTLSSLAVQTISQQCTPLGNVTFSVHGTIRTDTPFFPPPPLYRYDGGLTFFGFGGPVTTDPYGYWPDSVPSDTYQFSLDAASGYVLAGTSVLSNFILPGGSSSVDLVLEPYHIYTARVIVRESGTGNPLADASVTLNDGGSYSETKTTGQGSVSQSDWTGGAGQANFSDDDTAYFSSLNINDTQSGQIQLALGDPVTAADVNEDFLATTYKDPKTTADWNTSLGRCHLKQLEGFPPTWEPTGECISTVISTENGTIDTVTIQPTMNTHEETVIFYASANNGVNWEQVKTYGTPYTFLYKGSQLRWKVYLATKGTATPVVSHVVIGHTTRSYTAEGTLESSTFDVGPGSTFTALNWLPLSQPDNTAVAFQFASNNDNATWNFTGPGNDPNAYYTSAGESLDPIHENVQYGRYNVRLTSADGVATPTPTNIGIIHAEGCIPPGQAFFSPLLPATYSLTVAKDGYTTELTGLTVDGNETTTIYLTPDT